MDYYNNAFAVKDRFETLLREAEAHRLGKSDQPRTHRWTQIVRSLTLPRRQITRTVPAEPTCVPARNRG